LSVTGGWQQFDVMIIGGGIAGLWTSARLRRLGYSTVIVESRALGSGQTIWSQGIIHGGLKYALTGEASGASRAIALMPEIWRECMAGRGEVDLSSVVTLSEHQWLWSTPGLVSRIAAAAASRAIRTPVEKVERERWPGVFGGAAKGVDVYRVGEPVLATASVVSALRGQCGPVVRVKGDSIRIERTGGQVGLHAVGHDGVAVVMAARHMVLAAGSGNAGLVRGAGLTEADAPMQMRPLHMVMIKGGEGGDLPALFGHCLGASTVPRLTITTANGADGAAVWWVGGGIAEEGNARSGAEQIAAAKKELAACLPWVDLGRARWSTGRIDRAEGLSDGGKRPDEPVLRACGEVSVIWPTKFAFAPRAAELVSARVVEAVGPGRGERGLEAGSTSAESAAVAVAPWDEPEREWTA